MSTSDCTQLSLFADIPHKRCTKCEREFPLYADYWHKNKNSPDGLSWVCIECTLAIAQTYYQNNREARIEAAAVYRVNNPGKRNEWDRRRYARNAERINAKARQKRQENPKPRSIAQRKHRQSHPEQARVHVENRRARIANAEGHYGVQDIRNLYDWQDGRCIYCGIPIFPDIKRDIHVDHVLALPRGGSNWPDNLVLSCMTCNDSKGTKTIAEWQAVRGW